MFRSENLFYSSIFCQHLAYGLTIPVLILWEKTQGLSFTQIALIESIGLINV